MTTHLAPVRGRPPGLVPSRSRAAARRGPPLLLAALCFTAASCGRQAPQISVAQYAAIQQRLAAQASNDAPDPAATPALAEPSGPSPLPPHGDAERRGRAAAALPPGVELHDLRPVGDGTRYALALATAERDGRSVGPNLVLFDLAAQRGVLLGEHDFGLEQPGTPPPRKLGRTFFLDATPEEPVVLGELFRADDDREPFVGACGWWLRPRKASFLCAPRLTPGSRYEVHRGQLVESWSVDSVGAQVPSRAGKQSGRKLRFVDDRWHESDSFRCVGVPLAEAFAEAGSRPLAQWQQDGVRRLTRSARRASERLQTDVAIAQLQDALALDGCASGTWRLLGRLEFEAGRPGAAATLAVAFALAPRDDPGMLDLADALAVLDVTKPTQRDSWHSALAVLGSRRTTRSYVAGAAGKSPRGMAAALYRAFLERTSSQDEWLAARRRKVEEKLAALGASPAKRRR